MSRRLPVYFLVDVSESMAGDEVYRLEEALRGVMSALRKDPHCLETVWVEFIAFAGKAEVLAASTELIHARVPELPLGGGTAMGTGLELLMTRITDQLRVADEHQKGDWKPLVFLLTDGHPTDDCTQAVERWKRSFESRCTLVAISMSGSGDNALLKKLSDKVVAFFDTVPESLHSFVQWISQSILSASKNVVQDGNLELHLPAEGNGHIVNIEEVVAGQVDERFIIVVGRCEKSQHPYLLKYELAEELIRTLNLSPEHADARYILKSAVALKESYFDWSAEGNRPAIDASQILGQPSCPHCGNDYSIAVDGNCGGVHCVSGAGVHVCPWCSTPGDYGSNEEGGRGLTIERGLG